MDTKEANTIKGTDKGFAVSAAMVIVSAVLWGLYGTFVTILTSMGLARNALVFLRMLGTSLPVGLLIFATDRRAFRVRKADIPLFICNGLFSLLFFTFCYTAAIKVTKIATAAALLYTAPAIVMVLSAILFHEKMNARKIFCCLLAVAGCAFASGLGGELFASGTWRRSRLCTLQYFQPYHSEPRLFCLYKRLLQFRRGHVGLPRALCHGWQCRAGF